MKNLISPFSILHSTFRRRNLPSPLNCQLSIINCQFRKAFTLVELMIVVAILGILAAIVLPEFQNQSQQAKEAAAKANLKIYREAIQRYAIDHKDIAPGYPLNNTTLNPSQGTLKMHLMGQKYLTIIPKNPFNNLYTVLVLANGADFPASAIQTDLYGWVYKPATRTIKLNWAGSDSQGLDYFNY